MKRRTRILSLLLAVLLLASLLPPGELLLRAAAEPAAEADNVDPPDQTNADYNLTIDFDYATKNGVTNLSDALRLAGDNSSTYRKQGDGLSPAIDENYSKSNYNEFQWKHVWSWTCRDLQEGSIRTYLASTDPADKYICLESDNGTEYHARTRWEPIKITTDKVLDLNGHYIDIKYNRNRNNSSSNREQNKVDLSTHNCWAFEIEDGATLTIIDSSAWRGEGKTHTGTGRLSFTGYLVDPYKYEIWTYCTRDLFHVNNGNLVIYGGTFQAGRKRDQMKSNFSWTKLTNVIGQAVELGVGVAEYATGIGVATEKYQNLLQQQMNLSALQEKSDTGEDDGSQGSTQTMLPRTGSEEDKGEKPATEKKEDTPAQAGDSKKDTGRNQTVDEKKQTKDQNIDNGKPGTKEGENKGNAKGNGKDDSKTSLAQAQENVVKQALDKSKVTGMVTGVIDLVQGIAGLFGSDPKTRVTQAIQGTVVRVGNNGSFVAYGGTFQGYGSTPNTRNAVVEVNVVPGSVKAYDHSKTQGGVAYIYGGTFEAYNGANVFNMIRFNETQYALQYTRNQYGVLSQPTRVPLSTNETGGVEVYYYDNQTEVANDASGTVTPIPVNTSNVQVRGGVFRCFYDLVNVATRQEGDEKNFAKFMGTMGSVNLGIESFNSDLIYDGRIQIVDKYGDGALVLLDDRADEVGDYEGLYHYRLFCGDTELRYKSYLEVYPNNADTNTSHSMQLSTYVGNGKRSSLLFADDQENDRTPYRQTENYFDYMFDDTGANAWSVMPNFHFQATDTEAEKMDALQSDVYGERLNNSEVWYYPEPLDASGHPIGDVRYGEAGFTGVLHGAGSTTFTLRISQRCKTDSAWKSALKVVDQDTIKYYAEKHDGVRETLRFFTYRVYRVDPLTRENLSESDVFGEDEPLIEVRYGAGSNDALKCKLPLKTVEQQIKDRRPDWKGYQQGEMYRIVLDVEEVVAAGYQGKGVWGQKLKTAKSQSTILFRCFSVKEQKSEQGQLYNAHDYTPLQWWTNRSMWSINDDGQLFFQAGNTAKISFVNAKTGMTDYRGDTRVFDVYYQWWEVKADGTPIRMIAGTDFYYDPANGGYDDHRFSSWNVAGDTAHTFVNTVDPNDPNAAGYTYHGLPGKSNGQPDPTKWKDYQLHAYIAGSTDVTKLTRDGSENLHLGNNRIFQDNNDRCYIPEDMAGKYLQVKVVVQNVRWPMAYDSKQTFYSHVVKVREAPAQPLTGTLNAVYTGDMAYGTYDKPVALSLSNITGLGSGESITSVYYYAGGHSKEFTGLKVTDPDDLPTVKFPADFYESGYNLQKVGTGDKQMFAQYTTSKGRTFDTGISTFNYQKAATSISRLGDEAQTILLQDLRNGKYENGMLAFLPKPSGATVGYDFTKFTSTDPDVAALDQRGYVLFGKIPGEATISGKGPDGKAVSVTFRVVESISSLDISGLKAPTVGKTLPTDVSQITLPEDANYHVQEVFWTIDNKEAKLPAGTKAENYHAYTMNVVVSPNDFCKMASVDFHFTIEAELADGNLDTISEIANLSLNCLSYRKWDGENGDGKYVLRYKFNGSVGGASSVVDKIYLEFPTEVYEGDSVNEWMEKVHIYTNGDNEQFNMKAYASYGAYAYEIIEAYGDHRLIDANEFSVFVPGVQTGLMASVMIPMSLDADFPEDKNDITVYVNGEPTGGVYYKTTHSIIVNAFDTYAVQPAKAPEPMPQYSIKDYNLVVGQTVDVSDLLVCDDPRVTISLDTVRCSYDNGETYYTYDLDRGTITAVKLPPNSNYYPYVYVRVDFDANGDGRPEYFRTTGGEKIIYANASAVPATPVKEPYHVTVLDPAGNVYATLDCPYGKPISIPEVENAFVYSITDPAYQDGNVNVWKNGSGSTSNRTYGVEALGITGDAQPGDTLIVHTIYADELQVIAGTNDVHAFIKDEDLNDVAGIMISVDGDHYVMYDGLVDLAPNTDYTLYYKQGIHGTVYTKPFRTAEMDYGVYVGRNVVTNTNLGNLERDGWHYDPASKTLTLKDFYLVDKGVDTEFGMLFNAPVRVASAIYSNDDLTIELLGDNSLLKIQSDNELVHNLIHAEGNLTIQGTGNLTLNPHGSCYGLWSGHGNIYLNGSGILTLDRMTIGMQAPYGTINYKNGTIEYIARSNEYGYMLGNLVSDEAVDKLLFTNKVHNLTISVGDINGNYTDVTEQGLRDQIRYNTSTMNKDEKAHVRIVPTHNDNQRVEAAQFLKSGSCTGSLTYYQSCACGHIGTKTFNVSGKGHELIHHEAQPATCLYEGWNAYDTCAKCNYSTFDENFQPPLGHDWVHHEQKDPTCTEDGYPEYDECSRCGLSTKLEIPQAVSLPTRAIPVAQNASGEIVDPEILKWCATGHNFAPVAGNAPSCTAAGTADHYKCVHCGELAMDETGAYPAVSADLALDALGHAWSPWETTQEPTASAAGVQSRTCERCGETETQALPPVPPANPFVDVPEGKYYYSAVLWAYSHEPQVTGGTDDTHFSPNKTCTREQIVTFLWKAKGAPEPVNTTSPFTDVKTGKYYFKAVMWAVENNITGGVSADKFGVGQPCKREQAMTFLWKACGSPEPTGTENPFTDVKTGKYYYKPILWAVENKITGGVSTTLFGVGRTCTRAQIVTFLYKAMEG